MDATRLELIEKELALLVERANERYEVDQIIVFGSAASGNVGPWSDIDVVIVGRTTLPIHKRLVDIASIASDRVSMDILLLTPEEYAQSISTRRFFREEIRDKGRVVFSAA